MLTSQQLIAFLIPALLITLSPGPDNLMVLSFGMSRGRAPGMAFGLGCACGCLSHTALAACGVGALLAASPKAFVALRVGGGLYLLWLGVQALRSHGGSGAASRLPAEQSLCRLFARGMLANAINPKVVLFFLSFLPQFVVPGNGQAASQTALLGLAFTLQAALLFSVLGYFSGTLGRWLNRNQAAGRWLDRLAGTVFVALGLRLMVSR